MNRIPTLLLISKVAPTAPRIETSAISAVKIGPATRKIPEKNPVRKRPMSIIDTVLAILISIQLRKNGTDKTSIAILLPILSIT